MGWQVQIIDLPSVARREGPNFGLHDDAEFIRQQIADIDGAVVVVAHSYGGVAVSEGAADLPNVRHIIYLAAFQIDVGESVLEACGGEPPDWWDINGDGVMPLRPHQVFYADLAPEDSARAIAQLRPQSLAAFTETQEAAAWRTAPSTYVVCEQDRAIPLPGASASSVYHQFDGLNGIIAAVNPQRFIDTSEFGGKSVSASIPRTSRTLRSNPSTTSHTPRFTAPFGDNVLPSSKAMRCWRSTSAPTS